MAELWPYVRGEITRTLVSEEQFTNILSKNSHRNFLYEIYYKSTTLPKQIELGDAIESNAYHLFFYMIARFYFFDNGGTIKYLYRNKTNNYLSEQALRCLPPRFQRDYETKPGIEYIEMPGCYWTRDTIEERWIYSYVRDLYKHIWESVPQIKGKYTYISRNSREVRNRRCLNEHELIDPLKRAGFSIYTMEHMTFEEQIRLFRSSEVITGLHGAGMAWLIFCVPGTLFLEIPEIGRNDPYKNHYLDICKKCGLTYYKFTEAKEPDPQEFPQSLPGDCIVNPTIYLNVLYHLLRIKNGVQ